MLCIFLSINSRYQPLRSHRHLLLYLLDRYCLLEHFVHYFVVLLRLVVPQQRMQSLKRIPLNVIGHSCYTILLPQSQIVPEP